MKTFVSPGRISSSEDEQGLKLEEVDLEQDTSELDQFLNDPAWGACPSAQTRGWTRHSPGHHARIRMVSGVQQRSLFGL